MSTLHMNRVVRYASRCEFCGEEAPVAWLILHQPGCPAGEDIEPDEDDVEPEENPT